jgi:GNAT superfamily N-acetyltransferase
MLTAPLAAPVPGDVPVDFSPEPDEAWLAAYRYRGAELPAGARQVLTNAEDVVFAAVRLGDPPAPSAAVARDVLTDGWLGVTAVTVEESHRFQGLATAVMGALQRWAAEQGGHSVYLQVAADNAPATAFYRRLGFIEHHRYHYRRRTG